MQISQGTYVNSSHCQNVYLQESELPQTEVTHVVGLSTILLILACF